MKPPILTILLLTSTLAFGQKFQDVRFQDVAAKGSPLSLVKTDSSDGQPYVFASNSSSKGVLALVASVNFKNATGKLSPLKSNDEREIAS